MGRKLELVFYASTYYLTLFSFTYIDNLFYQRHIKKHDDDHRVKEFSKSTSTANLRKHLYSELHVSLWVVICDELGIKITAQEALPAVRQFRQDPEIPTVEPQRMEYSKQNLTTSLVEMIVGDDLVSFISNTFTFG